MWKIFYSGLGTIISPFFEEKYNFRNILVVIIIGIIQILHLVHILSILLNFSFINDFYQTIGGEKILTHFMSG